MVGQRRGESAGGAHRSSGRTDAGRSAIRTALTRAAFVVLAVVAVACIDTTTPQYFNSGGFNTGTGGGGGGGGGQLDSNLVGTWSETVVDTVNGDPTNEQTIWAFNADGTASRTVITFDLTTSVSDTTVTNGTWTADGSTVTITFQAPDTGSEQFTYVINGSTLLLGQTEFVRTG